MKITATIKERSRNLPLKEDNQEGHSYHYLPLEARPTVNEEVDKSVKGQSSYYFQALRLREEAEM